MDYLSDEALFPDARARENAAFSAEEVRDAALCLMLNPNAIWARMILLNYELGNVAASQNLVDMAAVANAAKRLAMSINKYDRVRSPLQKWIRSCYKRGRLDAYRIRSQAQTAARGTTARASQADRAFFDPDFLEGMGLERVNDIHWQADLFKKAQEPYGPMVHKPVRQRVTLPGDGPPKYQNIPVGAIALKMSREELTRALSRLERMGTPLLRIPGDIGSIEGKEARE